MNLSKLNRILLQTLLLPVVALMVVSGVLVWQILSAKATVAQIQLADNNIATANYLSALIADQEAGIRGYQNTANEIFLQPYDFAVAPIQGSFARLHEGIAAQHGDTSQLDSLMAAHRRWVNTIAEPMIVMVRSGADTRDPGLNLRGKAYMDNVRGALASIVASQKYQRTLFVDHWQQQLRDTLIGIVVFALLTGLLIGLFARSRLHAVSGAFQDSLIKLRNNAQSTFENEQRLRAILAAIGDAVIVCDPRGSIELVNPVAQDLCGLNQESATGRNVGDVFRLLDENTHDPIPTPFEQVRDQRRLIGPSSHALLVRHDGTELHVDTSGAPIYDLNGDLAGIVLVFRNVSEQRRTQAALLASEKLAVAGRLAATIAHEIHNPLDAVVNIIYLLRQGSTPEEAAQFLEMAASELDRVTQISRAMLGMYRESRTPVAVDLEEVLSSVLLLLERRISDQQVTVNVTYAPGSVVTGFPAELRQVFTNLLTNALDVSATGSVIDVRTRPYSLRGGPAGFEVTVKDQGTGITLEDMAQLFQPFFTTKGEQGTGLGLWVSQGIVHKHGGSIHIDTNVTTEHHGTTIAVFLPFGAAVLPSEHGSGI
ncbi:PAS domain S-box-containing protein [Bryocella elongata]|uniref:histidine kinase n=1 Tax=Bryocella elongata TaxID=863522 RepID=A0A1H5WYS6_9BACT|nr:ATP-binding protein [Bryocella elongata]SEG04177.1 PAS domain S-box-containing protein [Bryocella elongata]